MIKANTWWLPFFASFALLLVSVGLAFAGPHGGGWHGGGGGWHGGGWHGGGGGWHGGGWHGGGGGGGGHHGGGHWHNGRWMPWALGAAAIGGGAAAYCYEQDDYDRWIWTCGK